MEAIETVPILVEEMSSWSREVLGKWVEDDYVVETWTEIALNLDLIGDFTRGNARLESIVERIRNGQISRRLEITTEQITPLSARVYSTYRNWPDEVARKGAVLATSIADTYGIGIVAVPKPNIIGEGLMPVLAAGQIGLILTQNNPLLNMRISDENLIGNNPLAICAPGDPPFLFDGSFGSYSRHSMISLKEHADRHGTLPPGIVLDANGEAKQDTEILYGLLKGDRSNGSFPPLGGEDVFKPLRINYSIYGNHATFLHAHVFARYEWEPEYNRKNPVWIYPEYNWTDEEYQWSSDKHIDIMNKLSDKLSELMNIAYK